MGASKESTFLRLDKHRPYLVHRYYEGDRRREKWTPLDEVDRGVLENSLKVKEEIRNQIVEVPCMNPRCNNTVMMTKGQLEEFLVSAKKRYDMLILPFCSKECRDQMLEKHAEKAK